MRKSTVYEEAKADAIRREKLQGVREAGWPLFRSFTVPRANSAYHCKTDGPMCDEPPALVPVDDASHISTVSEHGGADDPVNPVSESQMVRQDFVPWIFVVTLCT
jgi:hypothetical protein